MTTPNELTSEELNDNDKKKINEELLKSIETYRRTLDYMQADVPLGCLCLAPAIESALRGAGCDRVYDLLNRDLTEIKGLGVTRIRDLTTRLNQFLAIG